MSLEANAVKSSDMAAANLKSYTLANGIIDSEASVTFVTSLKDRQRYDTQSTTAKSKRRTLFYITRRKTALVIKDKAVYLRALVAPTFSEDLISVAQLTAKGNKILFTKEYCHFLDPSEFLHEGVIIVRKSSDNLYRIRTTLTRPYKQQVIKTQIDLPLSETIQR